MANRGDRTHHQQHHHHRRGRRVDDPTSKRSIAQPIQLNEPLRGGREAAAATMTATDQVSDRFVCEIKKRGARQPAASGGQPSTNNRGRPQSGLVRSRRQVSSMMELISANANRFVPFLLAVIIVVASIKVQSSVCDKLGQQTTAIKSSAAPQRHPPSPSSSSAAGISNRANNGVGAAATDKDQSRERSLAMLSESIERQHHQLKMPKLSNLILRPHHERPSKFDSGDDSSGSNIQEPNSISTSESKGSSLFHTTTTTVSKSKSNSSSSSAQSAKKSDDILRDIMRMHEQQQQQQQQQHHASAKQRPLGSISHELVASSEASREQDENSTDEGPKKNQQASSISRLRSMLGPNKVVAQLLSYITPLIGGKLAQSQALPLATTTTTTTNGSTSFRTNPFTGRSHALGSSLLLMNRKQPQQQQQQQQQQSSSSGAATAAAAAAASETSFLGPPLWTISGNRLHTTDGPAYSYSPFHSAAAASSHGADSNRSSWISGGKSQSSELSWDQSPNGDLMMTDSSSHLGSVSLAPFKQLHSLRQQRGHTGRQAVKSADKKQATKGESKHHRVPHLGSWLKNSANQMAHGYMQDTFRGLLTLSQLPIAPLNSISTAPSVLEQKANAHKGQNNGATTAPPTASSSSSSSSAAAAASTTSATINGLLSEKRTKALEDLYRYAYIVSTGMRRKRDPLKALTSSKPAAPSKLTFFNRHIAGKGGPFTQRSIGQLAADNRNQMLKYIKSIQGLLARQASPRGVMWDMATDPTLAVTLFHLLERASVALPLGFLLYPFVQAIRNPLNGINLGRVLPPRALHRSVEHELLAKRLDVVDKVLSRALRPSHRESFMGK